MNTYLIEQELSTQSILWEGFELNGFNFMPWEFDIIKFSSGGAWIANKEIHANDINEALDIFTKELHPILNAICFISQCELLYNHESFLVIKKNDNAEKEFYLQYAEETSVVPLHFDQDEIDTLKKATQYPKKQVFAYLEDANNSFNPISRCALLIMALESIAGEISPNKTNKDYIKNEILKDEALFHELFNHGKGFRNTLFHGKRTNETRDFNELIYQKIVNYFNEKHGFSIAEVADPPRISTGNYLISRLWLCPRSVDTIVSLKSVIDVSLHTHRKDIGDKTDEFYKLLHKIPEQY